MVPAAVSWIQALPRFNPLTLPPRRLAPCSMRRSGILGGSSESLLSRDYRIKTVFLYLGHKGGSVSVSVLTTKDLTLVSATSGWGRKTMLC